ncbi:hypothetical protein [Corynebacterium flavescens]|uniref:hypothetical protein n=1 Tax=Corynebacterium flavescens TaxID=28028 RepID=UPI001141D9E0|nr:hypothetical protein [Corynebacterium flavescens]
MRKDDDYCHPWRVEIDGVSYVRCTTWGMAMQEVSELTAREDIGHDTWERTMAITNHYWKRSTIDSKNPQKVEAAQWDGTRKNAQQIEEWVKSRGGTATWWNDDSSIFGKLYVRNTFLGIDRNLYASPGSFIVRSEKGKFFPCYEADFLLEYSIV